MNIQEMQIAKPLFKSNDAFGLEEKLSLLAEFSQIFSLITSSTFMMQYYHCMHTV